MESLYKKSHAVLLAHSNEMGVVAEEPTLRRGEFWYVVQFNNRKEKVVEQDLSAPPSNDADLASLAREGKWGRLQAVRCALGLERLQNTNRTTIYSYQAQRILFQAHQYKPLLKVLDSADRRLLIADEVGLGKTIEAGIILTELQARGPMDRVLIICPSRLREKWSNELNRKFNQDFQILDGRSFREAAARSAENPGRARLHAIVSLQTMRAENCREALTSVLGQVDLVIMDEAHHARNPSTSTSQLLRDACEVSAAVILLTATPLQLKNDDLFTLVSALRPAEFRNSYSFEKDMDHFAPIHKASALARRQDGAHLPEIGRLIESSFAVKKQIQDPLAAQVVRLCNDGQVESRREWIDLERQIQDLHPLGTIVTRTRKRDVDAEAPVRRATTVRCDFTSAEDEAYQRLLQGTSRRGWSTRRLTLGEIQRARQAASCLPAAIESRSIATNDDEAVELCDIAPSELKDVAEESLAANPHSLGDFSWSGQDSKLKKFFELLDGIWREEPEAKVLVFAFFKGTVRYLEQQLLARGVNATRIDGDVPSDLRNKKNDERGQRLRAFEFDSSIKVMLSTEVGSEGLDFQFCHVLVNYDLPWNPMVVEQRIGRIDRFGQKSKVIQVLNLVVRGTVEDEILSRLYDRIGIFERSIGVTEAILGKTMSELQADFVRGELTAQESATRVEHAANIILRQQREQEALEGDASELFGHEDYIREELNRVRKLGRYISEQSLISILEMYFEQYHHQIRIHRESSNVIAFRVTDELKRDIHTANFGNSVWIDGSDDRDILRVTTSGELAFRDKSLELLNANHPLVKAASRAIKKQMEKATARIGAGRVFLDQFDDSDIATGTYTIALFAHQVSGIRSRRILEPIAWHNETEQVVQANTAERLLFLAVESGKELKGAEGINPLSDAGWECICDESIAANSALRSNEDLENQARYVRRRRALDQEHEHNMRAKLSRLETANAKISETANEAEAKNAGRILPALRGQIEKAKAVYEQRLADLERSRKVSTTLSEPLAICVLIAEKGA
jgi:SNF2 family DNA or RNA helicase